MGKKWHSGCERQPNINRAFQVTLHLKLYKTLHQKYHQFIGGFAEKQPNNNAFLRFYIFSKTKVYCERNSVLTVKKCERAIDGGTYKIRLICEAGTFEASGYVNVLDVSEKPRNFSPDEIRAEHVKVSWDKPADDGGTPITGYIVRAMDIENGEWITVAEVLRIRLSHLIN